MTLILLFQIVLVLFYVSSVYTFKILENVKKYELYHGKSIELPTHKLSQIEDDGYSLSQGKRGLLHAVKSRFFTQAPGTLILIRHGESILNSNKTFTGWIDSDLNERGILETEHAARLLLERGYTIDTAYTSRLKRAIRSTWIILTEINQIFRPVFKSWRLNERMYGSLEGLSKIQTAIEMGEDHVQSFRVGLEGRPPSMEPTHPYWHGSERKYADLDPKDIPVTESLQDTMERTLPLWQSRILPDLRSGKTVMIVAHANSLRGIVKHIDKLSKDDIKKVAIPNGIPLVYKFDKSMRPIKLKAAEYPISGEFLEKKGLLRTALKKEMELYGHVPGFETISGSTLAIPSLVSKPAPVDPRILGLQKLNMTRGLYSDQYSSNNTATISITSAAVIEPMLITTANGTVVTSESDKSSQLLSSSASSSSYSTESKLMVTSIESNVISMDSSGIMASDNMLSTSSKTNSIDGPVVVIIRHGKTEYNKLGIFTGWDDAPLATEGIEEARRAGRILKMHGIEFDVVYTSWLSRAIETAWLILEELDSVWLPIMKTWRLNERMYGALTGLSKKMIAETYGEEKFRKWRRGYEVRPPAITSFSALYPGNDERYVKYVNDVRFSVFESLIRSISHHRVELHRKFPKTESLKDCMSRTIPYFTNVIYPQSIAKEKNVLIASSENAIRGLLMHLCEIPPHRIHEVEIPTGLPLVYDVKRKCIHLLDDGSEDEDLLSKYNFGSSPELLFRPCIDVGLSFKKKTASNVSSSATEVVVKMDKTSMGSKDSMNMKETSVVSHDDIKDQNSNNSSNGNNLELDYNKKRMILFGDVNADPVISLPPGLKTQKIGL